MFAPLAGCDHRMIACWVPAVAFVFACGFSRFGFQTTEVIAPVAKHPTLTSLSDFDSPVVLTTIPSSVAYVLDLRPGPPKGKQQQLLPQGGCPAV